MRELPKGWVKTSLGEILLPSKEKMQPGEFSDLAYLSLEHIDAQSNVINGVGDPAKVKSTKNKFSSGDVLYGRLRPYLNKVVMPDFDGVCSTEILVFKESSAISNAFLKYYFSSLEFVEFASKHSKGINLPRISQKDIDRKVCDLPPLNEQERIVERLDKILGKVNSAKVRLNRVPSIIQSLRQSIYDSGVTGELSDSWRSENDFPSADDLSEMILDARREERNSSILFQEKESPIDIRLPESWRLMNLDKLCLNFTYGSSQKSQQKGDVPVLRMGNIQNGVLDWSNLVYSSDEKEIDKYRLARGDVLFNRTNSPELVGKTAIYRGERDAIYAGYLIKISPPEYLNSEYLNLCLNSSFAKNYCWQVKTDGVSQSNINAKKLGKMPIPFCSPNEQKIIVDRALDLLRIADQIEERYNLAMKSINKITISVLAKAFRGELVHQDPQDEPASVLIRKVKAQKKLQALNYKQRSNKARKKTKDVLKMISPILDVLRRENKPLTAQSLLKKSGYPLDSGPEQIEDFFLDIKKALIEGVVTRERINDEDVFRLSA